MFVIALPALIFSLAASVALADISSPPSSNLPDVPPETILTNILNWLSGILALISVLVIVIAGIMWATSGGSDTQIGKARTMIIYAIVGLVIAGAAYGFVNVIVSNFLV